MVMIASAALAVKFSKALLWKLRQFAFAAPGVEAIVDEKTRQPRNNGSSQLAGQPIEPAVAEHDTGRFHRPPLGNLQQTAVRDFLAPCEQLVVQVDLYRTNVGA